MSDFIIIENEKGMSVAKVAPNEAPEDAAVKRNGIVIDAGPFHSFDDAYDAMLVFANSAEEEVEDTI